MTVIDFRLYRLAFAPALLAGIVVMFSLQGAPRAIEQRPLVGTFESDRAAAVARQIVSSAPEREPGSAGDERIADLVVQRFGEIGAGAVNEQSFDASVDGDDVSLRNVILTLPGTTPDTIVIVAERDSESGPGAASSAAATGILIELATALGERDHDRSFVLASTSGGALGAREMVDELLGRDAVEAVVVISQPGAASPRPPYVVASSSGFESPPVQLRRTAEAAVSTQAQRSPGQESPFTRLARLALPSGLGPQAPLVAEGVDAVAVSSAGERPLAAGEDGPEDVSSESIDAFGRSVQSLIGALDLHPGGLEETAGVHLEISDNLIPGWALALLALSLIVPAAVAAVDAIARAARAGAGPARGVAWAAAWSLPFVGALAILYGLAIFGAVPRPEFPFDPGQYGLGTQAAVTFALMVVAAAASALLLRRLRVTGANAPDSAVSGLGAISVLACTVVWLANPYLALLLAPAAHVWLLASAPGGSGRGIAIGVATAVACLPAAAAVIAVSQALSLGRDAPWTFALMVGDGQIGLAVSAALCFLGGALVGTIALAAGIRKRTLA